MKSEKVECARGDYILYEVGSALLRRWVVLPWQGVVDLAIFIIFIVVVNMSSVIQALVLFKGVKWRDRGRRVEDEVGGRAIVDAELVPPVFLLVLGARLVYLGVPLLMLY